METPVRKPFRKQAIQIDVIVPIFNPSPGWENRMALAANEIRRKLSDFELTFILVDDGSERGFSEFHAAYLSKNMAPIKLIHSEKNFGKGHAIRLGLAESTTPFIIYTDSDFPYTTESIAGILQKLDLGTAEKSSEFGISMFL